MNATRKPRTPTADHTYTPQGHAGAVQVNPAHPCAFHPTLWRTPPSLDISHSILNHGLSCRLSSACLLHLQRGMTARTDEALDLQDRIPAPSPPHLNIGRLPN
eukprot:scaffold684_cov95-Isochrysis_galbana.AAC.2